MTVTKNADVDGSAKDLQIEKFRNSANFNSLIGILVAPVQFLEDILDELRTKLGLTHASGSLLELLAKLAGEPLVHEHDNALRAAVEVRIAINSSEGTPEDLLEILASRSGASSLHYIRRPPAAFVIYMHEPVSWYDLAAIKDAVIGSETMVVTGSPSGDPFVFGKDGDASGANAGEELSYGTGWGESGGGNESEGGDFTELFVQ